MLRFLTIETTLAEGSALSRLLMKKLLLVLLAAHEKASNSFFPVTLIAVLIAFLSRVSGVPAASLQKFTLAYCTQHHPAVPSPLFL